MRFNPIIDLSVLALLTRKKYFLLDFTRILKSGLKTCSKDVIEHLFHLDAYLQTNFPRNFQENYLGFFPLIHSGSEGEGEGRGRVVLKSEGHLQLFRKSITISRNCRLPREEGGGGGGGRG